MIDVARNIDQIFGAPLAQVLFVIIALVAIVGLFLNSSIKSRAGGERFPSKSKRNFRLFAGLLTILVGTAFGVVGYIKIAANEDIDAKLKSGILSLAIDGQEFSNTSALIQALMNPCDPRFRRSHPISRHNVLIETKNGLLTLQLGRDSGNDEEYWVFYPDFQLTRINEVRRACDTNIIF